MTNLGDVTSDTPAGLIVATGYDEITGTVSTTSATLADITGLSFDLVVPTGKTATIQARMNVGNSTTGGSPSTGAWAVSIGGVDGTEIPRYLSGTNDNGALGVQAYRTGLAAGTYTIKGRHRRVTGSSTVDTDVAELSAFAVLE
jgi:subtilase family serine protease